MCADKHWQTICDDLKYVTEVKKPMWRWLGEITGDTVSDKVDLRDKAVWSSLAVVAYSFRDSFERLTTLPLSLTQGDLYDNLERLSAVDYSALQDEFSKSMRLAMEMGVEKTVLVEVLALAREAPCCTNLVEQGHGSGAATLKSHAQFGTRSLQVRASIHQCRALFSELPRERQIARLDAAIARSVKLINGPRYSAPHAFLKHLQGDPDGERQAGLSVPEWSRICLGEHRVKFGQLSWERQMEFQAEADAIDVQRRRAWQDELQDLQRQRSSALRQLAEDVEEVGAQPNLVSSHRLCRDDLSRCADVVHELRSSMSLEKMREQLLQSAEGPCQDMVDMLLRHASVVHKPSVKSPDWVRLVALNREQFYGSAVYQTTDQNGWIPQRVFMPLIALQRPYTVVWLFLDLVPAVWGTSGIVCQDHTIIPKFTFEDMRFSSNPSVFTKDGGELWVLEGLVFSAACVVCAPESPIRFRFFTRHMHLVKDVSPSRTDRPRPRHRAAPSVRGKLLDEFPWLTDADLDDVCGRPAEEEGEEEEEEDDEDEMSATRRREAPPVDIDEAEYEKIRREMLEKRAEYAVADEDKFFYVRQRGGDANVFKIGQALDCAAMFARKGVAVDFCRKFEFPKQKSYHYSKYGGDVPANVLIREFARKGHYFCCLWLVHDCDDGFRFSEEDVRGYESKQEFLDLMGSLSAESAAFAAARQIDKWRPKGYEGIA
jgi:hypothetical protein